MLVDHGRRIACLLCGMTFGNRILDAGNTCDICAGLVRASRNSPFSSGKMVRIAGLEPARITPLPPQSSASANSAICAGLGRAEASFGQPTRRSIRHFHRLVKLSPGSEIVGQDRLQPAADFAAVVGPDALAPVAVATGLRAEQVEQRVAEPAIARSARPA